MKALALAVALVLIAGCTSHTPHGPCVGLNGDENPKLKYHYSAWNIAMGIIFFEAIIPPIYVLLNQLKCPVGPREAGA